MVLKKKLTVAFIGLILAAEIAAGFQSPATGLIMAAALSGIIPHLLIILTAFLIGIKTRIIKKKKAFLVAAALLILIVFYMRYSSLTELNQGALTLSGNRSALTQFYRENMIDLNNISREEYLRYKPVSIYEKGSFVYLRDTAYFNSCGFNMTCLEENLFNHGISREDNVILYCMSGITSARFGIELKKLGYENVKVAALGNVNNTDILAQTGALDKGAIILELKESDIGKDNWTFLYFSVDDFDPFFEPEFLDRGGRLIVVNPFGLPIEERGHAEELLKSRYTFLGQDIVDPQGSFLCTNRLNCMLTQAYIYQHNLSAREIFRYCKASLSSSCEHESY